MMEVISTPIIYTIIIFASLNPSFQNPKLMAEAKTIMEMLLTTSETFSRFSVLFPAFVIR